ncbi:SpoIIE family protein phosphatase [Streptomyces griseoaurantiacus]|uniref:SpoIIE family protein phosphatase n=1 Tax=Streptomyces griseoaurantiacus TaxID=68213 RepID=UPI0037B2C55B
MAAGGAAGGAGDRYPAGEPDGSGDRDRPGGRDGTARPARPPAAPRETVLRTLSDMSEGFLLVDEAWRISFANREAVRLLGAEPVRPGRSLWQVAAITAPGLEGQCRRATAEGRPIGFDLTRPLDGRLYFLRLVPVPEGGLGISFVDVTDHRPREDGQPLGEPARERAARMAELTTALAEAVTSKDVVRAVAEHVLPPVAADGLVVETLEGGRIRVVDSVGYTRDFLRRIDGVPLTEHTAVADVLRNRTPLFVGSAAEFEKLYPRLKYLSDNSPSRAWAFLPLIVSGRATGSCVISFSEPRTFSEDDRTLLTALSSLVAQALERARLFDVEHTRAQGLQRGLLPRTLPSLPAVTAAARYLPAGRGDEVGGDWYDVIPLSADRVAMVIGDVMGHGITEAATMGRLRTAVRTLADLDMDPDELLTHLSEIVGDLGYDYYATCLYAVFDPVTRVCSYALAGHLPPLLVHPDGTVHAPDVDINPPLGAADPPFDVHELRLPEEALLVFCTDGLVESPERDADQGLTLLRQTLGAAVTRSGYFDPPGTTGPGAGTARLEELCDLVVSTLLPDHAATNDDAALLIAHTRCTPTDDVASCSLPEDPRAAGQAREYVRSQLDVWGLDDLVMSTELLVSELIGNVVRHAGGPIRLRLMRSRSLICEVYDGSLTTPRIRRVGQTDEGGRGLHLVAALSRRWGTRYLADGKCIWTEQDLPHPEGELPQEDPPGGPVGA